MFGTGPIRGGTEYPKRRRKDPRRHGIRRKEGGTFFVDRGVEGITIPEPTHAVPALWRRLYVEINMMTEPDTEQGLTEDAIGQYEQFLKKYPDFPLPVQMRYEIAHSLNCSILRVASKLDYDFSDQLP